MRISSGIAEIGFGTQPGGRVASGKLFLWPLYNAGRVEIIHGVTRRTESNGIYIKPSPEDRDRIMNLAKEHSENEYSRTGRISRTPAGIRPGSLFEAIV